MDDVQRNYMDAYYKANGTKIKITKYTKISYVIKGDSKGFTAKQIENFANTLRNRVAPSNNTEEE